MSQVRSPFGSRRATIGAIAVAVCLIAGGSLQALITSVKPYAVSITGAYETRALLSAGDRVPLNPRNTNEYFFVTTGGATGAHELGRRSLRLNPSDPTRDATLSVIYNADRIIAAGGDIAISPDNVHVSGEYLMIQEDGTTESRAVMAAKGRDGSIWRFPLRQGNGVDLAAATRLVELDPPGRTGGPAVGPGVWETSGIVDASRLFGPRTWLFDVQAHSPTPAPAANTVEDGQLLLLVPTR
jgi:hypothetical protein